jgi:predicted permease
MSAAWHGLRRLLHIATRRGVERDVDDELRFHVESRVADLVARGYDPAAARQLCDREFGDLHASRRELIDVDEHRRQRVHRAERWEAWWDDVRYSVRALRRTPGLSTMIIVLFALGIGANAATFTVADSLFVRPPAGVANPDGLARLYVRTDNTIGRVVTMSSTMAYAAYAELADVLEHRTALAAYTPSDSTAVGIGQERHTLRISYSTANYFPIFGAHLSLGRSFTADEDRMGAGVPVAVIAYDVWQRDFGGDSTVLGKQMDVELARYTIIGVAAREFNGPDLDRTDIWLPIALRPGTMYGNVPWYLEWRAGSIVRVVARPMPGVDRESIADFATGAYRRGQLAYAPRAADTTAKIFAGPILESLGPSVTPPVERVITSRLLGVTLFVLLIACANVANLLLLRGVRRRREIAIRLSLGISRGRLARQLLIESTLLALVASAAAIGVAAWGGALLRTMILPSVHWATSVITWRVAIASVGVALVTGVLAGLLPALRAGRTELTVALKAGARESGAHRSLLRDGLVVAQAALSVVLLAGAGLFVRSLLEVHSIDLGYDVNQIAYGTVIFRDPQYRYVSYGSQRADVTDGLTVVAERLHADPDVESVSLASSPPMAGYAMMTLARQEGTPIPQVDNLDPALIGVQPSYFATTGIKLLHGRLFTAADQRSATPVLVVNETAARTYWPGRDAVGECLVLVTLRRTVPDCVPIVGVSRDSHLMKIVEGPTIELFAPILDKLFSRPQYIIVRATAGRADRVVATLRDELARQFPTAEPPYVMSGAGARAPELRPWRVGATLFSLFGVLALVVASLGVYSTLAYSVGQRLHEMGVRIALGAQRPQIVRLVLGAGLRALTIGIAAGIVLTVALGRYIASMLYGTRPTDPLVLGGAALLLIGTGLLGSLIPAWRAMRVDPVVSLRAD